MVEHPPLISRPATPLVREPGLGRGVTYFTMMEPDLDAFAPVLELLK
ncbi:hypothetical protein [Nocardia sp. NPDC057030]